MSLAIPDHHNVTVLLMRAAVAAARELLADARTSVGELVIVGRRQGLRRVLLEREQHAAHGLAWTATYVEALRPDGGLCGAHERRRAAWASSKHFITQIAFSEYLAQLSGGIPMSQGEVIRPDDARGRHGDT